MSSRRNRNKRIRRKSGLTKTHLVVLFFVLLAMLWGYTTWSEDITISVVDKRTEQARHQECVRYSAKSGCLRHKFVTTTFYVVVTPTEEFTVEAELYDQIALDKTYQVVVSGWKWFILPRRITTIQEIR